MNFNMQGTLAANLKTPNDGLKRTDWQTPETMPTIPGPYEAVTGGGHVFVRKFDGKTWRNSVNNEASSLCMPWRGVEPGSLDPAKHYDATTRMFIYTNQMPVKPADGEQHERP